MRDQYGTHHFRLSPARLGRRAPQAAEGLARRDDTHPAMPLKDEWRADLPQKADMDPDGAPIAHWISYSYIGITPEVRAVIEALEPNLHQYNPCLIRDRGRMYEYFTLKINAEVGNEAWCKEKTDKTPWRPHDPPGRQWSPAIRTGSRLVMKREAIIGKHLFYCNAYEVLSNELHDRLGADSLLSGLRLQTCFEA